MSNLDYSPPVSPTRNEEEHLVDVGNEGQSTILILQRERILYRYVAMLLQLGIQLRNIPPPPQNMELSDYNPMPTTLYTRGTQEDVRTAPDFTLQNIMRDGGNWGAWFAFIGAYFTSCGFLMAFVPLNSPRQTHLGFSIMAIASAIMTVTTSWVIAYYNNNFQDFSPVFEVILKILFWFFTINTPLSLLLLMFIPPIYAWCGYVIVSVLFVFVLAFNFKSIKSLLVATRADNVGDIEMV